MQTFAAELVDLRCDCILGQSTPVVAALKKATQTIPVVFVAVSDPIGSGLVESLARPGGNITGFTNLLPTITGKYLSILRELKSPLTRVAVMYNPESVPKGEAFYVPRSENLQRTLISLRSRPKSTVPMKSKRLWLTWEPRLAVNSL